MSQSVNHWNQQMNIINECGYHRLIDIISIKMITAFSYRLRLLDEYDYFIERQFWFVWLADWSNYSKVYVEVGFCKEKKQTNINMIAMKANKLAFNAVKWVDFFSQFWLINNIFHFIDFWFLKGFFKTLRIYFPSVKLTYSPTI